MTKNAADIALFSITTDTGLTSQPDMPEGHTYIMCQYTADFHNTFI